MRSELRCTCEPRLPPLDINVPWPLADFPVPFLKNLSMEIASVFVCPICTEIAVTAVTTDCCGQVYCNACVAALPPRSTCPTCRSDGKPIKASPNPAVRRAIEKLPTDCPYECGITGLLREALEIHKRSCPSRKYTCGAHGCSYAGAAEEYAKHIVSAHLDVLLAKSDVLFSVAPTAPAIEVKAAASDKRIETLPNDAGRTSRLGATGMRYCLGDLPGRCGCCDGRCGPSSGCACPSCMKLEVSLRKLPHGWLVNRDGCSAQRSDNGLFYCGRRVLEGVFMCDGYCGPSNGPQCAACKKLNALAGSWYAALA